MSLNFGEHRTFFWQENYYFLDSKNAVFDWLNTACRPIYYFELKSHIIKFYRMARFGRQLSRHLN